MAMDGPAVCALGRRRVDAIGRVAGDSPLRRSEDFEPESGPAMMSSGVIGLAGQMIGVNVRMLGAKAQLRPQTALFGLDGVRR